MSEDSRCQERVTELKQKLYDSEEKIRILRSLIKDLEDTCGDVKIQLAVACSHESVERERYYYSGMHTAEYVSRCLVCDQEVGEAVFYRAKKKRHI